MLDAKKKLFEALVREHAEMLVVYIRAALGNTPDVDDILQETMVVAWRRLDDFDQTRPFGGWIRGIAKNLLLAHRRQQSTRPYDSLILDQLDSRLGQLAARSGDTWEEKLEVLRTCVQALPDHDQRVIQLRYFQQLAIRQVSELLESNEGVVKKRLQRAREKILDCIEQKLTRAEVIR